MSTSPLNEISGGNSAVTVDTTSSLGLTFKSLYLENSTHHNQTIDLTAPSIRYNFLDLFCKNFV